MVLVVRLSQMSCGDSCVDLRGGYVVVAEKCLYKDGAGAVLKQMGSETMAEAYVV